jgi:phosphatidate phosphatase APP1
MVFLVLTRAGLDELTATLGRVPSPLWVNAAVLSDAEVAQLRSEGAEIKTFAEHIIPDERFAVEAAVNAVREHHAGSTVWIEQPSQRTLEAEARRPTGGARERTEWKRALQSFVGRADNLFDDARQRIRKVRTSDASITIIPYLGVGTSTKLQLNGRVLMDAGFAVKGDAGTGWRNTVELYKRMASKEIRGARVRARFNGVEKETATDREGYFSLDLELAQPLEVSGWHTAQLELLDPLPRSGSPVLAAAEVLVPPATAKFGVISDIDDTVVWTNVTNKLKMLMMLSRSNAYTRKPFKGVAALYRALRDGVGGDEGNPIFYVSSSPWNLFTPLVEFMRVQGIPRGPLFLKDYGDHTLFESHDHQSHKLASIERILQTYPQLQFILIGDSGEQDPEIYSQVVSLHPERIRVIYIRNVNPDPSRIEAIDRLIAVVRQSGAQLVLAPDSEFAATHAAAEGLVFPASLDDVRSDKREDEAAPAQPESVDRDA